ncbi:hypothetical protein RND81_04G002000 [Saponaria officinalis]|uniref:Disease resistance N-terminal domain-containing protein n=1 Tax=Saponaria officinalis TaxID=3572 RepID=A0AAW1LFI9_SAPOF
MQIAEYVVPFVMELIGSWIIHQLDFLWCLKDEISSLQLKLRYLNSFLTDFDASTPPNQLLQTHTNEIRSLARQMHQVIHRYRCVVGQGSLLYKCIHNPCTLLHIHHIRLQTNRIQRKVQEAISILNDLSAAATTINEQDPNSSTFRSKL